MKTLHENQRPATWLEDRLRSERPAFAPPAGFTERVLENLPKRASVVRASRARFRPWRLLLASVLAAACAVLLLAPVFRPAPAPTDPAVALRQVAEAVKLPAISVSQVEQWTAKLDEPLQKELKNVISDTRQAIQFVASNFLPEN